MTNGGAETPARAGPCKWIAVGEPVKPVMEKVMSAGMTNAFAFAGKTPLVGADSVSYTTVAMPRGTNKSARISPFEFL